MVRHRPVVMGSATFFDDFNALSIAFVPPVLVLLWHITAPQVGIMIGASYVGQVNDRDAQPASGKNRALNRNLIRI